jgi:WD40 repeat protein
LVRKNDSTCQLLIAMWILVLSIISTACQELDALKPATTEGLVVMLQGHEGLITSLAFSPDGATLASGGVDTTVRLWDIVTGKELTTLYRHPNQTGHPSCFRMERQYRSRTW